MRFLRQQIVIVDWHWSLQVYKQIFQRLSPRRQANNIYTYIYYIVREYICVCVYIICCISKPYASPSSPAANAFASFHSARCATNTGSYMDGRKMCGGGMSLICVRPSVRVDDARHLPNGDDAGRVECRLFLDCMCTESTYLTVYALALWNDRMELMTKCAMLYTHAVCGFYIY